MAAVNDDAKPTPPAPVRIGPFKVRAPRAEVEAFGHEISADSKDGVPFTFPIRWFAHPDIRAAGERLGGAEPWVPIHESQSFDYQRPLAVDVDYSMTVEMSREMEPARLVLRAEIADSALCLRSEMILRIIPTSMLEQA
ncbi:MAG TPA: hypothetical protein VGG12_00290 [Methylovirgula sp.]|jgi:hypothetical protein